MPNVHFIALVVIIVPFADCFYCFNTNTRTHQPREGFSESKSWMCCSTSVFGCCCCYFRRFVLHFTFLALQHINMLALPHMTAAVAAAYERENSPYFNYIGKLRSRSLFRPFLCVCFFSLDFQFFFLMLSPLLFCREW